MEIRQELKDKIKKEVSAAKSLSEIDQKIQKNKVSQKKRRNDLEFYLEVSRLMVDL